jgi:peptide/nickel transport system substrate-binding protein
MKSRAGALGAVRRGRAQALAVVSAFLVVAALALSGATPGAPADAAAAASPGKVTFTVGMLNNVDSFNPFLGIEAESYEMWALMYDYMINYNMKDMSPRPGLAKSWDTSPDGLTWTFHIRTGIRWSDGKPLTAADIAYTYNRILDGGTEASSWGSYLASVSKVTAPNATTVVLTLKKPNAVLPLLPMPIIPEHIWKHVSEKQVKTYANEPPNVVGSGPFRITSGKASGSLYTFVANPHYWQGRPNVDRLVFRVYNAEDTLVQALKKGDVDFAEGISPLQVKALEGQPGITAQMGNSPGFDEIAFNTGSVNLKTGKPMGDPNPAVLDPKFRFALNFAIDRSAITQRVYQGGGQPAGTIIPPAYPSYRWTPPTKDAYAYDPKKAARLLDAAGYVRAANGKRTMPDGSPIKPLRLFARSESQTSLSTMKFFKEYLDHLGIPSKVTAMESKKLTNTILTGDYDTFQWGWYVEPDPDSMLSYFTCAQRGNWSDSWWCNKKYDALYAQQHTSTDQAQREAIVKRMQAMLYKAAPYLNTVYTQIGEAYRSDRFHCFVPQPQPGGILLFQYGVNNYVHMQPASKPCENWAGSGQTAQQVAASDRKAAANVSTSSSDSGSNTVLVVVIALAVLVGLGGLLAGWAFYRRASADDRE